MNNFKGLAKGVRSVFPDDSRTIHQWREKQTVGSFSKWCKQFKVSSKYEQTRNY